MIEKALIDKVHKSQHLWKIYILQCSF